MCIRDSLPGPPRRRPDRHQSVRSRKTGFRCHRGRPAGGGYGPQGDGAFVAMVLSRSLDGRVQRELCRYDRRKTTRSRKSRLESQTEEAPLQAFHFTLFPGHPDAFNYPHRTVHSSFLTGASCHNGHRAYCDARPRGLVVLLFLRRTCIICTSRGPHG